MSVKVERRDEVWQRCQAVGYDYESQPKLEVSACPLCGGTDRTPPVNCIDPATGRCADRYGFDAPLYLCRGCGFGYLSPRMTAAAYGEFYAGWYRKLAGAYAGKAYTHQKIAEDAVRYVEAVLPPLTAALGHPSRRTCLDVGGSLGIWCGALEAAFGYQCTLLDPAPDEAAYANHGRGRTVVTSLVEDYETDQQFDVVSCLQTIDHVLDPLGTLHKFRKWVAPHGVLLLDFIDWRIFARNGGQTCISIKLDHPNYFTSVNARLLLDRTGFEPVSALVTSDHRHLFTVCRPVPVQPDATADAQQVRNLLDEFSPREDIPCDS